MADKKKNIPASNADESTDVKKQNVFATAWKKVSDFSVNVWKKVSAFFVRIWKKIVKVVKDTIGELKKVVWLPKSDVFKSFKLVIAMVVVISLIIAVIDSGSSWIINTIAKLVG